MSNSPTSRTLQALKRQGWRAQVVEKYNHHTRRTHDLFGFIDVLAVHPETGKTLAVQATSGSNGANRCNKIAEQCHQELRDVFAAGWIVEVWAWRKLKTKTNQKWFARIVQIAIDESGNLVERMVTDGDT